MSGNPFTTFGNGHTLVESLCAHGNAYLTGKSAYAYDKDNLKDWSSYNPEQQADIVEDWFSGDEGDEHKGNRKGNRMDSKDKRYFYIQVKIRGRHHLVDVDDEISSLHAHTVVFAPKEDPLKIPSDVLFGF